RTGTGSTRAGRVRVARLEALGRTQTDCPVLWLAHPPGGMIDGLLGLDFFRGLVLTLDFARGRLSLDPPRRWWQFWRGASPDERPAGERRVERQEVAPRGRRPVRHRVDGHPAHGPGRRGAGEHLR